VAVSLFSLSGFWLAFGLGNVSGLLLAYIIWALATRNGERPWPKLRRRKRLRSKGL
jgi:hypothetical protein